MADVVLGEAPLRITASYGDDAKDREGYIDIKVRFFDYATRQLRGVVVENTAGVQVVSRFLELTLDDHVSGEFQCGIIEITNIRF